MISFSIFLFFYLDNFEFFSINFFSNFSTLFFFEKFEKFFFRRMSKNQKNRKFATLLQTLIIMSDRCHLSQALSQWFLDTYYFSLYFSGGLSITTFFIFSQSGVSHSIALHVRTILPSRVQGAYPSFRIQNSTFVV